MSSVVQELGNIRTAFPERSNTGAFRGLSPEGAKHQRGVIFWVLISSACPSRSYGRVGDDDDDRFPSQGTSIPPLGSVGRSVMIR